MTVVRSTIRTARKPSGRSWDVDYEEVVPFEGSGGEIRQYRLEDGRLKLVNRQPIAEKGPVRSKSVPFVKGVPQGVRVKRRVPKAQRQAKHWNHQLASRGQRVIKPGDR